MPIRLRHSRKVSQLAEELAGIDGIQSVTTEREFLDLCPLRGHLVELGVADGGEPTGEVVVEPQIDTR